MFYSSRNLNLLLEDVYESWFDSSRFNANWLTFLQAGMFNFRPSVRPVPLEVHISGFPGKHYCPRMATMNKPTYTAIRTHSPAKPVLIFVSSRRQTRLTALDLMAFLAADADPKQWMHMPEHEVRLWYHFCTKLNKIPCALLVATLAELKSLWNAVDSR